MIEDLKGNFWEDLLIHLRLGRTYESKVAKEVNVTYSHVVKTVVKLVSHGMIESEKLGRCNYIQLSESGSRVAKHLSEIKEEFRNNENQNTKKRKSKSKTKQSK